MLSLFGHLVFPYGVVTITIAYSKNVRILHAAFNEQHKCQI